MSIQLLEKPLASRSMDVNHSSNLESPDAMALNQGEPKDISRLFESSIPINCDQNQKLPATQVPRDDPIPQTPCPEYDDGYFTECDNFASTSNEAAAPFVTIPVSSVEE